MKLDLQSVRNRLPGRRIIWLDSTTSTMQEAQRLIADHCPSGTVVGAEEQSSGIGRHGRLWLSEREAGLYESVVLRLPMPVEGYPVVTLALGLATAEAITQTTGIACDLRWPNDVLIEEKKCAGILAQILTGGAVIAGIGVNVNQTVFPEELQPIATSLRLASGRVQSREDLLVALLPAIDSYCRMLVEDGKEPILRAFSQASSYVRGRRVVVDQGDVVLHGVTAGLDPSGFLILEGDDGRETLIFTGGVRPA